MLKPQCVSTSLCLRLYRTREWIHKAVSLSRETQGGGTQVGGRYKEIKKEKDTHAEIEGKANQEFFFFLPGLRVLQKPKPKRPKMRAFNLTVSKEEGQPLLIESVTKTRLTCKK